MPSTMSNTNNRHPSSTTYVTVLGSGKLYTDRGDESLVGFVALAIVAAEKIASEHPYHLISFRVAATTPLKFPHILKHFPNADVFPFDLYFVCFSYFVCPSLVFPRIFLHPIPYRSFFSIRNTTPNTHGHFKYSSREFFLLSLCEYRPR